MKKTISIMSLLVVMLFVAISYVKAEEEQYTITDYIKVTEMEVNSIEPTSIEYFSAKPINEYIKNNFKLPENFYVTVDEFVDNDPKKVVLQLGREHKVDGAIHFDDYDKITVNIKYQQRDEEAYKTSLKILEEFKEAYSFEFDDLVLINYYVTNPKENFINEDLLKFSKTYKDIMSKYGKDFEVKLDSSSGMGVAYPLYISGGTFTYVNYKGIFYAYNTPKYITSNGFTTRNVIYVPSDTEKTNDAYVAAAKKRINEAFPNVKVEIYPAGADSYTDTSDENVYKEVFGEGYNGVHYVVYLDDAKHEFAIIPSDKIETVKVDTKDEETKVSVSTSSLEIPLDTVVTVKVVAEGSQEHKNIVNVLKTNDFIAYDISLYSNLLNNKITKLESGKFEVRVPIIDKLKGKKLSAYYIGGEKIEEYPVTIAENGEAIFETTHFSEYIIAEASLVPEELPPVTEINPNTGDKIVSYVIMLTISVLALAGVVFYLIKPKKEN